MLLSRHRRTLCISFYFVLPLLVVSSLISRYQPSRTKVDAFPVISGRKLFHNSPEQMQTYQKMLQVSQQTVEEFKGKSVLLTGASGGLGAQLARQLALCGVKSIVLSARKADTLKEIESDLEQQMSTLSGKFENTRIYTVICDLSDKSSVHKLGVQALELCGGTVDCLINCGGVSSRSNFVDTQPDIDEKVMQINFFSGALLAKLLVPAMVRQHSGRIIWISSVQGLMGIPSRTSYAASKFAVQGYCESLRAELAPSGVAVHCVSPGYIRTNLSRSAITGDGTAHGKMDETTASGADPKEVAVEVLDSVARGKLDFIVAATASAKVGIWLRLLCPGILQRALVKRFEKSEKAKAEDEAATQEQPQETKKVV